MLDDELLLIGDGFVNVEENAQAMSITDLDEVGGGDEDVIEVGEEVLVD